MNVLIQRHRDFLRVYVFRSLHDRQMTRMLILGESYTFSLFTRILDLLL